jgi:hypothetical protein
MKRALAMVFLLASSAAAQVGPSVNPYNPYASSTNGSTIPLRPYVSLDRLHVQRQYQAMPSDTVAIGGTVWKVASQSTHAAGFRQYPNYPALSSATNGSRAFGRVAAKGMQPLPLTAPLPIEISCDPYRDESGCLNAYAGLGP